MERSLRLKKRSEYSSVYREGTAWVGGLVVMKAKRNRLGCTRYGFSVNKRVGKAVKRNRLKRLLKEITRPQLVKPGWDIVFIIRPEAVAVDYHELKEAIVRALVRAQLLESNVETTNPGAN